MYLIKDERGLYRQATQADQDCSHEFLFVVPLSDAVDAIAPDPNAPLHTGAVLEIAQRALRNLENNH